MQEEICSACFFLHLAMGFNQLCTYSSERKESFTYHRRGYCICWASPKFIVLLQMHGRNQSLGS